MSRHTQKVTHQSSAAAVKRAETAVFWPHMSADIKLQTEKCVTCAFDAPAQSHESLQSHDLPGEVWSKIGIDIFTFMNKDYLLLVDYFSDLLSLSHCQIYSRDESLKRVRKLSQCLTSPSAYQKWEPIYFSWVYKNCHRIGFLLNYFLDRSSTIKWQSRGHC